MLQLTNTPQIYVSKDFQQAKDINYQLTIKPGFRPAVCFSANSLYFLTGSSQNVQLQFFTYTASKGYTYITPVQLGSNEQSFLGASSDSQYYNLDTTSCFVIPENTAIPMGGYNTPNEAFFGFRISGYCVGTNEYCLSQQNTTNQNLLSFMNSASNSFVLYTQVNQYNPTVNSVLTGQLYAQTLREGTNNFNTAMAI